MMQDSSKEFQRITQNGKLDENLLNNTQSVFSSTKYHATDFDNQPDFLFSRTMVTTHCQRKYTHDTSQQPPQQLSGCCEAASSQPFKSPLNGRTSTSSTDMNFKEFISDTSNLHVTTSNSSSTPSDRTEHLLPMRYANLKSNKEKRQRLIESKWGEGTTLDIRFWDDTNAPVVKINKKNDVEEDTTESAGILTDKMISACSSFLSKSPENGLYVETKCELVKLNLHDISVIYYHHYLKYIDLTNNNISDLTPLGGIPYLMYLNAAENKLKDVLRFKPPWYLTYVNLAYNKISQIDDLSEFWSIVRLDLSHNAIECIQGLGNLRYLRFLNLGYNLIECVENLDDLNLQELNLEFNCITDFKSATSEFGISTLRNLRTLILRHNKLSTLECFEGAYGLRYIDLKFNKIAHLLEITHLKSMVHEVDLRGNTCTKWPNYRDVLLYSMPSVMYLDGISVTISEKVSAGTIFAPSMHLVAARSITKLMLLEHLNAPNIDLHVTPIDQSTPPLIILCGPPAVKKSILARQIADNLPKRVRFCTSHTTRITADNAQSGKASYQFVSREEFNEMARRGEFLSTEEMLGNSYGFHVSEIAALVLEKKVGITHMDLHAALQMQGRYMNAKLILVLTKSRELHRQWIQEKFGIFTWVKSSVQNLVTIKGRRHHQPAAEIYESSSRKLDFIGEILREVIQAVNLPLFDIDSRAQRNLESSTDITIESPTVLPTITKTESEVEMQKKHIAFEEEDGKLSSLSIVTDTPEQSNTPAPVGLKVILDEQSNIIIENEKEKRERQKAKVLLHHHTLHLHSNNDQFTENEEFGESRESSEELFVSKPNTVHMELPKVLEELYSKIVTKSRESHLQQHLDNLGCFSLVLFTDEFELAYNQLVDFIYEFYINQPSRKPMFSEQTKKYMECIPSKTKAFVEELRENRSTSDIQKLHNLRLRGLTSWNQALPSQLSQNPTAVLTGAEAKYTEN